MLRGVKLRIWITNTFLFLARTRNFSTGNCKPNWAFSFQFMHFRSSVLSFSFGFLLKLNRSNWSLQGIRIRGGSSLSRLAHHGPTPQCPTPRVPHADSPGTPWLGDSHSYSHSNPNPNLHLRKWRHGHDDTRLDSARQAARRLAWQHEQERKEAASSPGTTRD
jgi:hypothetical protein